MERLPSQALEDDRLKDSREDIGHSRPGHARRRPGMHHRRAEGKGEDSAIPPLDPAAMIVGEPAREGDAEIVTPDADLAPRAGRRVRIVFKNESEHSLAGRPTPSRAG